MRSASGTTTRAQARAEQAKDLYDVMEAATCWFEEQLGGIGGADARAYLEKRAITDATRKRFRFGYAPDSRGKLKSALKQFGTDKLVEAGLLRGGLRGRGALLQLFTENMLTETIRLWYLAAAMTFGLGAASLQRSVPAGRTAARGQLRGSRIADSSTSFAASCSCSRRRSRFLSAR